MNLLMKFGLGAVCFSTQFDSLHANANFAQLTIRIEFVCMSRIHSSHAHLLDTDDVYIQRYERWHEPVFMICFYVVFRQFQPFQHDRHTTIPSITNTYTSFKQTHSSDEWTKIFQATTSNAHYLGQKELIGSTARYIRTIPRLTTHQLKYSANRIRKASQISLGGHWWFSHINWRVYMYNH